jgi:hypothetical protein
MGNSSNLLLLLIPESLLGPLLLLFLMAGGLAIILGFRRKGMALIITAISFPIVAVVIETLMNELFGAMPGWLVIPVSMALLLIVYLMIGWGLIKMVFGQRAIDEAKGHLLADAVRGVLRMTFTRTGLVVFGGMFLFLYLSVVL